MYISKSCSAWSLNPSCRILLRIEASGIFILNIFLYFATSNPQVVTHIVTSKKYGVLVVLPLGGGGKDGFSSGLLLVAKAGLTYKSKKCSG